MTIKLDHFASFSNVAYLRRPKNKIDFDFVENQKSLYFTFRIKNKIDFDLKKVKIQSNFIIFILILTGLNLVPRKSKRHF